MSAAYEREICKKLIEDGWYADRGPGSMGRDVLAFKHANGCTDHWHARVVVLEVKKTSNPEVWYFKGQRVRDQWKQYKEVSDSGIDVAYGVRFVTGPRDGRWRFYPLHGMPEPEPLRREEGFEYGEYFDIQ